MAQTGSLDDGDLMDYLNAEELDALKNTLAMLLLENTDIDIDDVYSLVFRNGRKIIWS